MDLSAEQFSEVLNSLGEGNNAAPSDKRRAMRITHRCRVSITLGSRAHAGPRASVTVKDFSPRGICLVREQAMRSGENFIIALSRRGAAPISILCTVVHCRRVSANMHTIGAEFTCIVDAAPPIPVPATAPSDLDRIRHSVLD